METVEELKRKLAEAEARENGFKIERFIAVRWKDDKRVTQYYKMCENGTYVVVWLSGSITINSDSPKESKVEEMIPATDEMFSRAYSEALDVIKKAIGY